MAITIGTVQFSQGADPASVFHVARPGMVRNMTASGTPLIQDNGRSCLIGSIILRFVPKAKTDEFRNWLMNTAKFGQNTFTITPDSFMDIGAGAGVALDNCQWDADPTTDGVIQPSGRLGRSDINIYYKCWA